MPDWILLLPILFPLVGALIFTMVAPRTSVRTRRWLPTIFLAIEILAIFVTIAPGAHRLVISDWQLASFSIAFRIDGITLLLLLTLFVPLLALWLVAPPRAPFDLPSLGVVSAAIVLTCASGPGSVYYAWTLLDLALFGWRLARDIERESAVRSLVIGQFAGLILLGGAVLLAAGHADEGALLLALAYWARLGLFPFHPLLPTRGVDAYDLWLARGVPLVAASNLWLHWSSLGVDAPRAAIGVMAGAALIATLIWTWREDQPTRAIVASSSHAFVLVPLAIGFGGDAAMTFSLWLVLAATLAIALFEAALRWRAESPNRLPRLIGLAGLITFAGLPLTPAFIGRIGLYVSLWENGQGLLISLAAAAIWLIFAPVWKIVLALAGSEARQPTRVEYAGLGVLGLACAALALAPMLIAHMLAPEVGDAAERALDRVIRTDDALGVAIGAGALLFPLAGSYYLRDAVNVFRLRGREVVSRSARLFDLDWLGRVVARLGYRVGAAARDVSTLAEENPTIWILFIALWIAIFISNAR